MRCQTLAITLFLMLVFAPAGFSQGKDPPKKPDNTQITEVAGKTIEQWIKEINSEDASKRTQAIHSVLYFGPERAYEAVPTLLAVLKKNFGDPPLDASVRHNLVLSLGVILKDVKEPDVKYLREATLYFKRLLKDPQVMVRYRAAQALGWLGDEAKEAAFDLLPLVKDTATWEIRQAACIALGTVATNEKDGPHAKIIETLYLAALKDKAQQVRLAAVQSLTYLGAPNNPPNMKAELLKYLEIVATKDSDPMVQIWAHMAVMSIGQSISEKHSLAIMQIAMKTDRVDAKVQACQAMGTVGTKAKVAAPYIIKMLADRDPGVVYWAMWSLIQIESQNAIPVLEQMVADPQLTDAMKKGAKEAIEEINKKLKNPKKAGK